MHEAAKAAQIKSVFDDAHRSELSVVILDDLERLLDYARIGPRFSNVVLQTLLTCIKKVPKSSKLVVLATTSSTSTLEQLELQLKGEGRNFDAERRFEIQVSFNVLLAPAPLLRGCTLAPLTLFAGTARCCRCA